VLREFDVCLSQGEPLDLSLASRQVDTESRGTVEYAVVQLVTEGSLVYALGVCVGDVITRINGHPALYSKLSLVYQEIHSETRPQTVSFARIAAENAENVLKRPPQHWLHEDSDHAQIAAVSAVRAQEQRLALTGLRTSASLCHTRTYIGWLRARAHVPVKLCVFVDLVICCSVTPCTYPA
jgi:hypothetical protein